MATASFRQLLHALCDAQVEFIVVGGVSAVLQGAPITTLDLDIVHNRDRTNVDRLCDVLDKLSAVYRLRPELPPNADGLVGEGHHLLLTDCGPLDILGKLATGEAYPDLLPTAEKLTVDGRELCLQGLEGLIRVKELLGSEKDRAVLPLLRSTLDEVRRQSEE